MCVPLAILDWFLERLRELRTGPMQRSAIDAQVKRQVVALREAGP